MDLLVMRTASRDHVAVCACTFVYVCVSGGLSTSVAKWDDISYSIG